MRWSTFNRRGSRNSPLPALKIKLDKALKYCKGSESRSYDGIRNLFLPELYLHTHCPPRINYSSGRLNYYPTQPPYTQPRSPVIAFDTVGETITVLKSSKIPTLPDTKYLTVRAHIALIFISFIPSPKHEPTEVPGVAQTNPGSLSPTPHRQHQGLSRTGSVAISNKVACASPSAPDSYQRSWPGHMKMERTRQHCALLAAHPC